MTEAQKREAPPVDHPVVRTHPETGRTCLYLGDHAESIVGMPYDEGRALIDELNALAVHPDLTYEHRWQPHELIVWDNRCLMHRATAYDPADAVARRAPLHRARRSAGRRRRGVARAERRGRRPLQLSSHACRHERRCAAGAPSRTIAGMLNGLDKFLLFVALPAVVIASLIEAIVLARAALVRLARQRGVAVRPVRARRGADLPAAVDRDAADRARLPAPHRRHRARQRHRAARALHRPGVLLLLVPPRRAPRALVLVQPRRPPLGQRAEPLGRLPHRHPQPGQRQLASSTCR